MTRKKESFESWLRRVFESDRHWLDNYLPNVAYRTYSLPENIDIDDALQEINEAFNGFGLEVTDEALIVKKQRAMQAAYRKYLSRSKKQAHEIKSIDITFDAHYELKKYADFHNVTLSQAIVKLVELAGDEHWQSKLIKIK